MAPWAHAQTRRVIHATGVGLLGILSASAPGRGAFLASGLGVEANAPGLQPESASGSNGDIQRSELRESAIQTLLLLTTSEDAQVRANAIEGLLPAPARLETVLGAFLTDENLGVRSVAAVTAGKLKLTSLIPALKPLVRDPSPFVRGAAVYALRACGEPINPTPLGTMVISDPSPRVRAQAAFLLGELADKGTVAMLRDAARVDLPRAQVVEKKVLTVQIAEALVKLGDEKQLHTIRAALYPSSPGELEATVLAIQVLGELHDKGSIGQLRNLAVERGPKGHAMPIEVRLAVAGVLGGMGDPEYISIPLKVLGRGTEPQQVQAVWALGQIATPQAVRELKGLLGTDDPRLRVAVASSLLHAVER